MSARRARTDPSDPTDGASRGVPTLRDPHFSQSLERGLAILACYTAEHPVLGVAEVAKELEMGRSTTHRYMQTLLELGYLEQGRMRKYRLGLRVTDLGMSALGATGLAEHAHELLEQLRDRSGYTVSLAVLDGTDIIYVDRARSHRRQQYTIDRELRLGARLPAYCTAMGKALLAHLPEHEQRTLLAETKLVRRTPRTIVGKARMREQLQQVRERGVAVDDEEYALARRALAVPVRDELGEACAAVGIAAPASAIKVEDLVERLGPHVIATADQISARLGHRRADERAHRL